MTEFTYGVPQEQDWNALGDDEFRKIIRTEFETNYPQELRFLPHRPPFAMVADWWKRMSGQRLDRTVLAR